MSVVYDAIRTPGICKCEYKCNAKTRKVGVHGWYSKALSELGAQPIAETELCGAENEADCATLIYSILETHDIAKSLLCSPLGTCSVRIR